MLRLASSWLGHLATTVAGASTPSAQSSARRKLSHIWPVPTFAAVKPRSAPADRPSLSASQAGVIVSGAVGKLISPGPSGPKGRSARAGRRTIARDRRRPDGRRCHRPRPYRKRVVEGKSGSVRDELGGLAINKKKK